MKTVIKSLYYDSTNDVLWIGTPETTLHVAQRASSRLGHADVSVINAIVRSFGE